MSPPSAEATSRPFDAVVIGGGPAGSSCALWLKGLGYEPLLIEARERLGGLQAESPYRNAWIVALPEATGFGVADNIQRVIEASGVRCRLGWRVTGIACDEDAFVVQLAPGAADAAGGA